MDETNLALLIVRVVIGLTMAAHGWNKAKGLDGVAGWFDAIGMKPGKVHARFAAFGEILAGLCLAAGLLTSFAALGFVGLMTVAMLGPGEWSLDNAIGIDTDLDGYVGLVISAGGGLAAAAALLAAFFRPPPASA